jgi:hypothetical protein
MVITVVSVLGAVVVGATIVWLATRSRPQQMAGYAPSPSLDLGPQVAQIRALIRAANNGDGGAAAQAAALLDNLEATYGHEAVARACNPNKLRGLIAKVQARHLLPAA